MTTFLFSILIFSLMIFTRAFYGLNLDMLPILVLVTFLFLYFIPIYILEGFTRKLLVRKPLEKRADNKGIYTGGLKISLLVAFLQAFMLSLYFFDSLLLLYIPAFYIAFVLFNFILVLIIVWLDKRREIYPFKKVLIIVLAISFILLIYSGWEFSKCEWRGCGNWTYLLERAKKENNPSVCKLGNIGKEQNFYINVLLATENSLGGKSADDLCYKSLAVETNNIDFCEMVPGNHWKSSCYFDLSKEFNDPSLCEKTGDLKTACYRDLARKLKNPSLCERAGDFKDGCYFDLATIELMDPSLCEKIDFNLEKDGCYRVLASKLNDPLLCEEALQKDVCLEDVLREN